MPLDKVQLAVRTPAWNNKEFQTICLVHVLMVCCSALIEQTFVMEWHCVMTNLMRGYILYLEI